MKKLNKDEKTKLLGLIGLNIYILYYILNLVLSGLNIVDYILATVILSVVVVVSILKINKDEIKENWKDFKKNYKQYFNDYFKYYVLGLLFMVFFNILNSTILDLGISENENTIRSIVEMAPLYIFITAVIIGPIQEELVFRLSIRKAIKSDFWFIVLSSLIFSYMHLSGDITCIKDLLLLLPYFPLGVSFAYILTKSKNIFNTISLHTIHNGILVVLWIVIALI